MDTIDRLELNQEQINALVEVLNDSTAFERYGGSCWNPRHSFFFYDAQDMIIGYVMLCFECHEISYAPMYGMSKGRTTLNPDALNKLERLSEDAGLFTSGISIASFRQPSK